jgi:hypothetical protein
MRWRFSLLPRFHGECGWATYTGRPVAVISAWRAVSVPQSPVSDRRIWVGSPPVAAMTAWGDGEGVASGHRRQDEEPRGPLDQGGHRRPAVRADDQSVACRSVELSS